MMKPEETSTPLSNDTEISPRRGWLKRGLMPLKPASTPSASRSEKAHEFNSLKKLWETSVRGAQPLTYQRPMNSNEGFALLGFGRAVGDQAKEAIKFAIANWDDFVSAAKTKYGLFGPQPAEPHVLFFVKYHDCGVNLLLQSVAKKKQDEEREPKRQEPGTQVHAPAVLGANVKQRSDNVTCIGDQGGTLHKPLETAPVALFLTHEQVAFMCDLSQDHDAFFDKIDAQYRGCIMRGLASKELLAGEMVMDRCKGRVVKAVLCDIPVTPGGTE